MWVQVPPPAPLIKYVVERPLITYVVERPLIYQFGR